MGKVKFMEKSQIAYCFNSDTIPYFVSRNVKKEGEEVTCITIQGNKPVKQTGKVGQIIAYERDALNITGTGWNCWLLSEDYAKEHLEFKNGVYYFKP